MKKAYRIKKNKEFQLVFRNGASFANRQLVIYYLHKEEQLHYRVGLSVSKKIGNAVKRNQIKRYLRQAFIDMNDQIHPEYDMVIIARMPTNQMNYHQMKKSLGHLLYKTRLFLK